MRTEALRVLAELARHDDRIVFLTGDLGYGVVEPFFREFPDRAFNAGVAEQNMVAMATGLAEAGLRPYVYSIATFATLRPFEFIRNGPVLHRLPVRIIGVGGGMEYSNNGPSHLAIEDVGVLRTQTGLTIICPNDTAQARAAMEATADHPGPIYYRLSKQDHPTLDGMPSGWDGTGAHVLREGDGRVALVALGAAAAELPVAQAVLGRDDVDPTLVAVSVVSPPPLGVLLDVVRRHSLVVTIESHHVVGGLGSLVCEVVAEAGVGTRVMRCGIDQLPLGVVGSPGYLARWAGVDGDSVAKSVLKVLSEDRSRPS